MTNRQKRTLCYAVVMFMIAVDRAFIGCGLFLALMDYVEEQMEKSA